MYCTATKQYLPSHSNCPSFSISVNLGSFGAHIGLDRRIESIQCQVRFCDCLERVGWRGVSEFVGMAAGCRILGTV